MGPVKEAWEKEAVGLDTMLDAGDTAIVTLSAGETRLVVHRAILAARSPVFEAIIRLNMLEVKSDCVTIANVEGPVLRQMVAYMYTLQAPELPSMVPQLREAADKFCLSGLKALCDQEPVKKGQETKAGDLATMLDAGDGAMVTLSAGETQLLAHRAILAARSPVFEAMFRIDMLEASSGSVAITDVEGPVLRQLLVYMYTFQATLLPSMCPLMLVAADKYGLSDLKAACEQQMSTHLGVENAATAAELAVRHSCPRLRQAAITFIKAHTHQVMMTQGWADAVVSHPHSVVELTRLIAEPEPPVEVSLSQQEMGMRLIHAAEEGAVEEVFDLLSKNRAGVRVRDGEKRSALHCAAVRGHVAVVRSLLEFGADVDAEDRWQMTPLHYAAEGGHAAVVRLLTKSYADVNAMSKCGRTPLHCAASNGHKEVVAALVEARAKKWVRDDFDRKPLEDAKLWNNQQLTEMLT